MNALPETRVRYAMATACTAPPAAKPTRVRLNIPAISDVAASIKPELQQRLDHLPGQAPDLSGTQLASYTRARSATMSTARPRRPGCRARGWGWRRPHRP